MVDFFEGDHGNEERLEWAERLNLLTAYERFADQLLGSNPQISNF